MDSVDCTGRMTRRQALRRLGDVALATATASALQGFAPGLASAVAGTASQPRRGGTLAIGTDAFPVDLVPCSTFAEATTTLLKHIYEGLVAVDPENGVLPKPALAESWEVSPDGRTYTFRLRQGVKFHDGTPFTAETIVLNFERLRNPNSSYYYKVGGPISSVVFADVERVEVVNDFSIRYHLRRPNGDFIDFLKRPYALLVSPTVIKQSSPEDVAKRPSGTGPFRLTAREEGTRVVFERFNDYWGGAPYLDRLVYRPYGDPSTREAALRFGEVDLVTYAQFDSIDRLRGRYVPFKWGLAQSWLVGLNTRHPFTKDARVRQALNYAVNRETIVRDLLRGQVTVAKGPYPPTSVAWNPALQGYSHDPDRARRLLAEAGFGGGVRVRAIIPTEISAIPLVAEVSQSIQADLRRVGVDVTYDTREWTAYLATVRPGLSSEDYIFYVTGNGADFMSWLEQMLGKNFQPPNGVNRGWYENLDAERLFDEARQERDRERRKRLYQQAEEIITRDAAWLFLLYYTNVGLRSAKLEGARLGYHAIDFARAWLRP